MSVRFWSGPEYPPSILLLADPEPRRQHSCDCFDVLIAAVRLPNPPEGGHIDGRLSEQPLEDRFRPAMRTARAASVRTVYFPKTNYLPKPPQHSRVMLRYEHHGTPRSGLG